MSLLMCMSLYYFMGRRPATKKAEGLRGGMIATGMVFDLEKLVDWCYDGIK